MFISYKIKKVLKNKKPFVNFLYMRTKFVIKCESSVLIYLLIWWRLQNVIFQMHKTYSFCYFYFKKFIPNFLNQFIFFRDFLKFHFFNKKFNFILFGNFIVNFFNWLQKYFNYLCNHNQENLRLQKLSNTDFEPNQR